MKFLTNPFNRAAFAGRASDPGPDPARPFPERMLFLVLAVWGGALIWMCPHLPLLDLPQHAGQVRLFRDLLAGHSPWASLVQLNLFTPYLLEYLLALPLWFIPTPIAFAVMLTAAYAGLVLSWRALRRDFQGDPRLDILFIPGFFGFAWMFGFVPFLLAAPLWVLFIRLARAQARTPAWRTGLGLVGCGGLLFFAHGMVFVLALLVAALLNAEASLGQRRLAWRGWAPCVPLVALMLAYLVASRQGAAEVPAKPWQWGWYPIIRLKDLCVMPLDLGRHDQWAFSLLTLSWLLVPWMLGCRLNRSVPGWWAPFLAVAIVFFLAPEKALNATYVYQRFALFFLPSYALMFRPGRGPVAAGRLRATLALIILAAGCATYLGVRTLRLRRFRAEAAGVDALLQALPPGKRILGLVVDAQSEAARNPLAYEHYLAWYQAQYGGFVDVNFAEYKAQVVCFRPQCRPALPDSLEAKPWLFQFQQDEGWIYDYIIVKGRTRVADQLARQITGDPGHRFDLRTTYGDWRVFQRRAALASTGSGPA